jgi:hypothetical protein
MPRDLTAQQFTDALERHGLKPARAFDNASFKAVFGVNPDYVVMPDGTNVAARNGGNTRRAQLAYLVSQIPLHTEEKRVAAGHYQACIRAFREGHSFSANPICTKEAA